jgi:hypothetical protein
MPYIPPANRPAIDEKVKALADEIAAVMTRERQTADISVHYRRAFLEMAHFIAALEQAPQPAPNSNAQRLAATIVEVARGYGIKGGWTGELNYAITMLIQIVPHEMCRRKAWDESLRYWIYAETVGALTRTAYDLHARMGDDYIGNGLTGVFEDIKDEYKRRVNSAYEAAQILKSGDCYDYVPFRTRLVAATVDGVSGYQEVMLPRQERTS